MTVKGIVGDGTIAEMTQVDALFFSSVLSLPMIMNIS